MDEIPKELILKSPWDRIEDSYSINPDGSIVLNESVLKEGQQVVPNRRIIPFEIVGSSLFFNISKKLKKEKIDFIMFRDTVPCIESLNISFSHDLTKSYCLRGLVVPPIIDKVYVSTLTYDSSTMINISWLIEKILLNVSVIGNVKEKIKHKGNCVISNEKTIKELNNEKVLEILSSIESLI